MRQEDFRDAQGFLHFSFNLDADGEYLALVEPDGQRIAFELTENYPAQFADVSYGMNAHESGLLNSTHTRSRKLCRGSRLGGRYGFFGGSRAFTKSLSK